MAGGHGRILKSENPSVDSMIQVTGTRNKTDNSYVGNLLLGWKLETSRLPQEVFEL